MAAADSLAGKKVTVVMNETSAAQKILAQHYSALDHRLQNSDWQSGASEAHGLLCALACRGVREIENKAWLLRLSAPRDLDLINAMFAEIVRGLRDDGFSFALLLPDDSAARALRVESLANWCGGFVQGFLHDGEQQLRAFPESVREPFADIMKISRIDIGVTGRGGAEHQLVEIEEYLRVAAQLIFDELNPPARAAN